MGKNKYKSISISISISKFGNRKNWQWIKFDDNNLYFSNNILQNIFLFVQGFNSHY